MAQHALPAHPVLRPSAWTSTADLEENIRTKLDIPEARTQESQTVGATPTVGETPTVVEPPTGSVGDTPTDTVGDTPTETVGDTPTPLDNY